MPFALARRLARGQAAEVSSGGLLPQARRHVPVDRATEPLRNAAGGRPGSGGRRGSWAAAGEGAGARSAAFFSRR